MIFFAVTFKIIYFQINFISKSVNYQEIALIFHFVIQLFQKQSDKSSPDKSYYMWFPYINIAVKYASSKKSYSLINMPNILKKQKAPGRYSCILTTRIYAAVQGMVFRLEQRIKFWKIYNSLVLGATVLPGWEFVRLGFEVREIFPDSQGCPLFNFNFLIYCLFPWTRTKQD